MLTITIYPDYSVPTGFEEPDVVSQKLQTAGFDHKIIDFVYEARDTAIEVYVETDQQEKVIRLAEEHGWTTDITHSRRSEFV